MLRQLIDNLEKVVYGYYEIDRNHKHYHHVLYAYAYAQSKYPKREHIRYHLCSVYICKHNMLQERENGNVLGMCTDREHSPTKQLSIFLSDRLSLDTIYGMGVLVHELVHSFQMIEDPFLLWSQNSEHEVRARLIQAMFITDQGMDVAKMMGSHSVALWSLQEADPSMTNVSFFTGEQK